MSLPFNHELIAEHGGNLCGADRFSVEACDRCQGHYLYNAELQDVYYDPDNFSRRFFRIEGMRLPPCRYCGELDWDFAAVSPPRAIVQTGPWGWVLQTRSFTFIE